MSNLLKKCSNIPTPAIVFNYEQGLKNIKDMQKFADDYKVNLRPHIKAHKIPKIAQIQISEGAKGITASKIDEVEVMINSGIKDIILAYPVVGTDKINKYITLAKKAKLATIVDNEYVAKQLNDAALKNGIILEVYIKVNTGLNRLGVDPNENLVELAKKIVLLKGLVLKGILTHAGHVYGASNRELVEEIGASEGEQMVSCKSMLSKNGIDVDVVSIGSTPTATIGGKVCGVDEIRPGNYVFYDAMQVGLGAATKEQCSLRVISTVIGRPTKNRVVIDAGSKVFALDKGAHGNSIVNGFGIIEGYPNITLARLSEEHGVIECDESCDLLIGDKIEIIPNHACTVINLTDYVYFLYANSDIEKIKVEARGKVN